MRRVFLGCYLLFALLSGLFLLAGSGVGSGLAAREVNQAALVVAHPDGSVTYSIVPFEEESLSGLELLKRGAPDVVTIEFGGLGEAVCSIAKDGCPVGDCRKTLCQSSDPDSPYWRYFGLVDGTWKAMPLGASNTRVGDDGVNAWAWTGDTISFPPRTYLQVSQQVRADTSAPSANVVSRRFDSAGDVMSVETETVSRSTLTGLVLLAALISAMAGLVWWKRREPGV